jgi:hypothetical protein
MEFPQVREENLELPSMKEQSNYCSKTFWGDVVYFFK